MAIRRTGGTTTPKATKPTRKQAACGAATGPKPKASAKESASAKGCGWTPSAGEYARGQKNAAPNADYQRAGTRASRGSGCGW